MIDNELEPYIQPKDFLRCTIGKIVFPTELGECIIYIYTSNNPIAHFHLINTEFGMDIPIKLFKPEYFGKPPYYLNDIEKKLLYDFLNGHEANVGIFRLANDNRSIWDDAVSCWDFNSNLYVSYPEKDHLQSVKIPDYTKLTED